MMVNIRNEYIRRTAHVDQFGDKVRDAMLRWFAVHMYIPPLWIIWTKDRKDGAGRQEKRKTTEKAHGNSEEGHAEGWMGRMLEIG